MFKSLFNKSNSVDINVFFNQLKEKNSVLKILNLSDTDFEDATQDELINNIEDLAYGVERVQKNIGTNFFGLFDGLLIKHQSNGDVRYMFHTVTKKADKIIELADLLIEIFGTGYFDDKKHTPFTEKGKIIDLSNGKYSTELDQLVSIWLVGKYTISIHYSIQPMNQFVLVVNEKKEKAIDMAVRRNGTILDLLKVNVNKLISQEEITKDVEVKDGEVKFIDYLFRTSEKELEVFDTIKLRIFDGERSFRKNTQTHLTLSSSSTVAYQDMVRISQKLIEMYGIDIGGSTELEINELDSMGQDFWTGRTWHFNEVHGLWDMENKAEKVSYSVSITFDEEDQGFLVTIMSYNKLIDYFGIEG